MAEGETRVDEIQLRVLRLMRDATAAGLIKWEQSQRDRDYFYTTTGPIQSIIRFKWPAYNFEVSSDRDFVEVQGAGRFMIGTPGWALALEVLGAGLPEWGRHVEQLREQYQRQADVLAVAVAAAQAVAGGEARDAPEAEPGAAPDPATSVVS